MALEPFTVLSDIIYFNKYIVEKSVRLNIIDQNVEPLIQILYILINKLVNLL